MTFTLLPPAGLPGAVWRTDASRNLVDKAT
jgi:hypothetical protein